MSEQEMSKLDLLKKEATDLGIDFHPAIGEVKLQEKIDAFKKENADSEVNLSNGNDDTQFNEDTAVTNDLQEEANKEVAEALEAQKRANDAKDAELDKAKNELEELKRKLAEAEAKVSTTPTVHTPPAAAHPHPKSPEFKSDREKLRQKHMRMRADANKLVRVNVTCMNPNKRQWKGEVFTVGNKVIGTIRKFVMFDTPEGFHVPEVILNVMEGKQCQVFVDVVLPGGKKTKKGKLIPEFSIKRLDALTKEQLDDLAKRQAMSGSIDPEM